MSLWIVSRETSLRLGTLEALVARWNPKINLVSSGDLAHLRTRHVEDSLDVLARLPPASPVVDLGSGAGFPGLVIAIAGARHVTLVEADARKAAFLREAARATGASVTILNSRIEACGVTKAPIITARALAPLDRLLALAQPLLAEDGVCFFPKGSGVDAELTVAAARWQMSAHRHPSRSTPNGCILEVRHLQSAGTTAPRG